MPRDKVDRGAASGVSKRTKYADFGCVVEPTQQLGRAELVLCQNVSDCKLEGER